MNDESNAPGRATAATRAVELAEVRRGELEEILIRRREAGLTVEADESEARARVARELVGMSLSGGGIRSASFDLGLIQALQGNELLRQIDYMSTVSGGGYVGGALSSLALHPETNLQGGPPVETEPHAPTSSRPARPRASDREATPPRGPGVFPLAPDANDKQPPRVRALVHGGGYLRRPLLFLNRYLIGAFLINLVALSGVLALVALAAWGFRCLDEPDTIDWLHVLGFRGDVLRAFFPAALFLGLWLLTWAISYWRRGAQAPGRVPQVFLVATLAGAMVALAALLGTGDISLMYLKEQYGIRPPQEEIQQISSQLKTVLVVVLVLALLPYFRVNDLIRSGTRPRNTVEGLIFAVASRALVYGLPLLLFGMVARENISNFNEKRTETRHGAVFSTQWNFVPLEFEDWAETWKQIEIQAAGAGTRVAPQKDLALFPVSERLWRVANQSAGTSSDGAVQGSIDHLEKSVAMDEALPFWKRWLLLVGHLATRQKNELTEQYEERVAYRKLTHEVCERLDRGVLRDPEFYKEVEKSSSEPRGLDRARLDESRNQLQALFVEAKQIHALADSLGFDDWRKRRDALLGDIDAAVKRGDPLAAADAREKLAASMTGVVSLTETPGQSVAASKLVAVEDDLARVNWLMVKTFLGKQVAPKEKVFARVVLPADQRHRLWLAGWAGLLFLFSALVVNLNATSMHGFYRNRLARMWLTPLPGMGRHIPLARLESCARGGPYHLINATVMLIGRRSNPDAPGMDVFTFSRRFCGSPSTGFVPTERFLGGTYDLANAVALSGAAVTPIQARNPLLALLLLLSNSRLGQWLPNPGHREILPAPLRWMLEKVGPVPLRLLLGAPRTAEHRDLCFISDGGHVENLGLETLLLRRCRVILVSDLTCDPDHDFRYLMEVVRRARCEWGIRFRGFGEHPEDLGLARLVPDATTHHAAAHFIATRIDYPTGEDGRDPGPQTGLLVFVKPVLTGDEEPDLVRHHAQNPEFPHDPTTDQFYNVDKFESYRQLGFHTGEQLGTMLPTLIQSLDHVGRDLATWARRHETNGHARHDRAPRGRRGKAPSHEESREAPTPLESPTKPA